MDKIKTAKQSSLKEGDDHKAKAATTAFNESNATDGKSGMNPNPEVRVKGEDTGSNPPVTQTKTDIRAMILAARKAPDEVAAMIGAQRKTTSTFPVYKTLPKGVFWRARSDGEWNPYGGEFLLLKAPEPLKAPHVFYLVPDALQGILGSDNKTRKHLAYYHLASVADTRGSEAIWAVPSRSDNPWHEASRLALSGLMEDWGMVIADEDRKGYIVETPAARLPEPVWAPCNLDDRIIEAFNDKILDSEDHDIIQRLYGLKA